MNRLPFLPRFQPKRIAGELLVTLILTGVYIILWYPIQITITVVANASEQTLISQGYDTAPATNLFIIARLIANVLIPILIIGLWIWCLGSAQRREWRGYDG